MISLDDALKTILILVIAIFLVAMTYFLARLINEIRKMVSDVRLIIADTQKVSGVVGSGADATKRFFETSNIKKLLETFAGLGTIGSMLNMVFRRGRNNKNEAEQSK